MSSGPSIQPIQVKNTESIKNSANVKQILQVLTPCGITYFSFSRIYADTTRIYLSSSAEWLEAVNERFYKISVTGQPFSTYKNLRILWSQMEGSEIIKAANEHGKMGHGYIEFKKNDEFCDIFMYGTDINKKGFDVFYINNYEILESFQNYFLEQADRIIKDVQTDRLIFPKCHKQISINEGINFNNGFRNDLQNTISEITNIRHALGRLSMREYECLKCLSRGMTIKEAARVLNISPRTVESHVESIKLKSRCNSRSQLLKLYWDINEEASIFKLKESYEK